MLINDGDQKAFESNIVDKCYALALSDLKRADKWSIEQLFHNYVRLFAAFQNSVPSPIMDGKYDEKVQTNLNNFFTVRLSKYYSIEDVKILSKLV